MTSMYVKHPDYMGKDLKIHIGRGDQTIFDNSILEGDKWSRFVGMGFLRKCSDAEVAEVLKGRGEKPPEPVKPPTKKEAAAAKKEAAAAEAKAKGEEEARVAAADAEAKAREAAAEASGSMTRSPAPKVEPATGGAKKREKK